MKRYFIMVQSEICQSRGKCMEKLREMNRNIFKKNLIKTVEEIKNVKNLYIDEINL